MNKAAGVDKISSKFLKEAADVLAYPLSRINLLAKLTVFKEECKTDKLKQQFKKGSKNNP